MSSVIIMMTNWRINLDKPLVLGFSGENKSKTLKIRSNAINPDAAYYLDVLANGAKNTIALNVGDSVLSVELTSDMLGYSGKKQMQIRAVNNETVTKSNIFNGEVLDSINATEDFARTYPTVYDQYEAQLNELNRLIEEINNLDPGTGSGGSGAPGIDGKDGKSAYEIAVENGFVGSESEWLTSLKGEKGDKGDKGETGATGERGEQGLPGTKGDKGDTGEPGTAGAKGDKGDKGEKGDKGNPGADGKTAYELAVDNGYTGTLAEWLLSLKGAKGDKGDTGAQGAQGIQGDTGESGIERQIVVSNAVTEYTISPNVLYVFPTLTRLDISFDETNLDTNIVNDYHFQFENGATTCELTLPEDVNIGELDIQPNTICEVSIINGLLSYQNWSTE